MSRKELIQPVEPAGPDYGTETPRELVEQEATARKIEGALAYYEDVFKALGRIEAAEFMATVAEKLIAETAIKMKEGKKYKGLPYSDENGNARRVATFEEFCEYKLGKSRRRVAELMSNHHLLGPELYERAEKLGFGQRDYNAIKALPEEEQAIIKQAIEAEDKDRVIDLLQDMAAKHVKEKESLAKKSADLQASLESSGQRNANLNKRVGDLEEELATLKGKRAKAPHLAEQGLIIDLQMETDRAVSMVAASLRSLVVKLFNHYGDGSVPDLARVAAAQAFGLVIVAARTACDELGLTPAETLHQSVDDPEKAIWDEINAQDEAVNGTEIEA